LSGLSSSVSPRFQRRPQSLWRKSSFFAVRALNDGLMTFCARVQNIPEFHQIVIFVHVYSDAGAGGCQLLLAAWGGGVERSMLDPGFDRHIRNCDKPADFRGFVDSKKPAGTISTPA